MGLISKLQEKHREKVLAANSQCDSYISRFDEALKEVKEFTSCEGFWDKSFFQKWANKYSELLDAVTNVRLKKLRRANSYKTLCEKANEFNSVAATLEDFIARRNSEYAREKTAQGYRLIGDVEGIKLDEQQMLCIVKESRNQLVVAGAGTGKTTTIIGKIKYMLKTGQVTPEQLLVLSYTNASAADMSRRINKETRQIIAASTFHSFALDIIRSVEGKVPKIYSGNARLFIKNQLATLCNDPRYLNKFCHHLLYNKGTPKSEFDFKSEQEYNEYLLLNPPTTFNHELVKSYGEMHIANFLFQNGIRYEYEASYIIDTNNKDYGQYHPDFYLPDYGVYIEYFGINREGNVPPYFKSKDKRSPSDVYRDSMEWKRKLHKANHTTLVECFAYENFEGSLLENLGEKLAGVGVKLNPLTTEALWEKIKEENNDIIDGVSVLFETVINLVKNNASTFADVRKQAETRSDSHSILLLCDLIEPVFDAYQSELQKTHTVDFNDMINNAISYIKANKYVSPYAYVIVDEYQDISRSRYELLAALRKLRDFGLFCVGDDWQSIYKFSGSDIGYILDFEEYWGSAEIDKIETTYRFSQSLIEISGNFIMQNPRQLKKNIRGKDNDAGFALEEICGYNDDYAVRFLCERLCDLPRNSAVYFIGRYQSDVKPIKTAFDVSFNNGDNKEKGMLDVVYSQRRDLKIQFVTAHKSKGLQADYVFILNNKNGRMGFPSKIQDAPIVDMLLSSREDYPDAEERRLFYVALTRAKKKVFIVTLKGRESSFAMELKKKWEPLMKKAKYTCPQCGGRLLRKEGQYGAFFGCSNYKNGCRYTKKIRSVQDKQDENHTANPK